MRRFRPALDLPVLLGILLCCLMGYQTRHALNPDGISYLDLADHFRSGEWGSFVQAYWSPLYPMLLAALRVISGAPNVDFLPWVHGFDTLLAVLTILVIWWTARRTDNILFGLAGVSLYLLAAGRLPRVEAVTPDLLLGLILAIVCCEILTRGNERWWRIGVLFGVAFLTKTSSWPWLLVAAVVALIGAGGAAARLRVLRIALVTGALALLWIVPMSVKYSTPTVSSAGRLNYCWYIRNCDSRTPDSHAGMHRQYQNLQIADGTTVRVAHYDADHWTYQPWGDPTDWDTGILGGYTFDRHQTWRESIMADLQALLVTWTISVTIAVLLPLVLVTRRKGMLRRLVEEERGALLLMLIGMVGIAQFLVIHAEPRLIAPFVLAGGLGVVYWLSRLPAPEPPRHPRRRLLLAVGFGWFWAIALDANYVDRESLFAADDSARIAANEAMMRERVPAAGPAPRIAVVGPAGLMIQDIWNMNGKVVAQVIQPPLSEINNWTPDQKKALLATLSQYHPDVIWVTLPDKSLAMIPPL